MVCVGVLFNLHTTAQYGLLSGGNGLCRCFIQFAHNRAIRPLVALSILNYLSCTCI